MLAGITDIKYSKFLLISFIARSVGLAVISYFGSGKIIPFSGWGIAVWIIIGLIIISFGIIAYKKRDKIKKFFKVKH